MTGRPRLWDLDDLVAVGDIAREFHVRPGAVVNWQTRYEDFPTPVHTVSSGRLFSRTQVLDCMCNHGYESLVARMRR